VVRNIFYLCEWVTVGERMNEPVFEVVREADGGYCAERQHAELDPPLGCAARERVSRSHPLNCSEARHNPTSRD
jgi:hypothetical protein